jgi:DNA-binding transcriptional LysR family regulator
MKPEQLRLWTCSSRAPPPTFLGFERQTLFTDTESVVVRKGHPRASRMSQLQIFLDSSHIAVVGRGRMDDPVDTWLRGERIERISLVVPSYLQGLHAAAATDLVAFVPTRLAQTLPGSCHSPCFGRPSILERIKNSCSSPFAGSATPPPSGCANE